MWAKPRHNDSMMPLHYVLWDRKHSKTCVSPWWSMRCWVRRRWRKRWFYRIRLGRVDELFDDNPHGNEMYQSQKGLAQFLIPRGNASKLLEIVEEPFYFLTEFIEVFLIV